MVLCLLLRKYLFRILDLSGKTLGGVLSYVENGDNSETKTVLIFELATLLVIFYCFL